MSNDACDKLAGDDAPRLRWRTVEFDERGLWVLATCAALAIRVMFGLVHGENSATSRLWGEAVRQKKARYVADPETGKVSLEFINTEASK